MAVALREQPFSFRYKELYHKVCELSSLFKNLFVLYSFMTNINFFISVTNMPIPSLGIGIKVYNVKF